MEPEIADLLKQMAVQMTSGNRSAPQRTIAYEDGRNMRTFLDLVEQELLDQQIGDLQWGYELREYLTGDALSYWMCLRRTETSLADWEIELVGHYLVNLPEEQSRSLTRGKTKTFTDWQEAAIALEALEAPWKDSCEAQQRYRQELADVRRRTGNNGQQGSRAGTGEEGRPTGRIYSSSLLRVPGEGTLRKGLSSPQWRASTHRGNVLQMRGTGPLRQGVGGWRGEPPQRAAMNVSPNWRQRLLPEGKRNTSGEDVGLTPLATEGSPVPTRTGEEQSGFDSGRCGDPARKHTQETSRHEAPQRNEVEAAADLPWWREGTSLEQAHECYGSLCGTGKTAVLQLEIAGYECERLLDTGASRSFIRTAAVEVVLNGGLLSGADSYYIILGLDWLVNHTVAWYFLSDKLRTYVNGRWCYLPVQRKGHRPTADIPATTAPAKTSEDCAYDVLVQQVSRMSAEEHAMLVRPPPKPYKSPHRAGARVKIKDLVNEACKDTANLERALNGLRLIATLPEAEPARVVDVPLERQGPLMWAIVEHHQASTCDPDAPSAVVAAPAEADTEDSPWPTAKLAYTEFGNWSRSHDALHLPQQILTVLQQHRFLFPGSLLDGLPPKRPYDHQILLLPGKLPTKAPIYKMPPDQLTDHTEEIARLAAKG
ncbi:hypothetical protein EBH_0081030 [Eimeria brunetti]|uniref:Uncharacterized protein n=1 Tax=Eimeria brunetti TaxID=51314 RepID=U6LJY8_9EIME|nr:hypothetical protein EBH_0081030 [Eimeria brunetti]